MPEEIAPVQDHGDRLAIACQLRHGLRSVGRSLDRPSVRVHQAPVADGVGDDQPGVAERLGQRVAQPARRR